MVSQRSPAPATRYSAVSLEEQKKKLQYLDPPSGRELISESDRSNQYAKQQIPEFAI